MKRTSQTAPVPTYEELKKENRQFKNTVSKLEKVEAELIEKEAHLRTVIESLPFDVFALDKNGRYVLQNSTCKKNWGDIIGMRPKDIKVDKDTLVLWEENNRRAFAGETVEGDVVLSPRGKKGIYQNIISSIRDGDRIRGIIGVDIDISKH